MVDTPEGTLSGVDNPYAGGTRPDLTDTQFAQRFNQPNPNKDLAGGGEAVKKGSFADVQGQLNEALKDTKLEDRDKAAVEFYKNKLGYTVETGGILADKYTVKDKANNIVGKVTPFYFDQKDASISELIRKNLEGTVGKPAEEPKPEEPKIPETVVAQPEKTGKTKMSFAERMRDVRERIGSRLKAFYETIDNNLGQSSTAAEVGRVVVGEAQDRVGQVSESLKHVRDEVQRIGGEAEIRLGMIADEVGGKVVDGTKKLAKNIGSGAMNALRIGTEKFYELGDKAAEVNYRIGDAAWNAAAEHGGNKVAENVVKAADAVGGFAEKVGPNTVDALKVGADMAIEGAAPIKLGVLGIPHYVQEGVEKVYEGVQQMRINSHDSVANKIERDRLSQWAEGAGDRSRMSDKELEADSARYQDLSDRVNRFRKKAEKIHEAVMAHKEKAKKLNIFKRAINAVFKKSAPDIEVKNKFNT